MSAPSLPIDAVLPDLLDALRCERQAVLQAPPGAGKTTRVPLALLQAGLVDGRIVMLEPRRLAARAAAERMADALGEAVGETVGYRVRGAARVSERTRIEVVTEGILTRRLQTDPELSGIGAVLFDEFHERSLNADLGLALALEIREALREDLMILPMSATLDAAPVAALMGDAPVVTAEGRAYAVEQIHLVTPLPKAQPIEIGVADLVLRALREGEGSVLAFLPGEAEIRRASARLRAAVASAPEGHAIDLRPLYGAMPFAEQRSAVAPAAQGRRKVVLATSIAETSLTIEGVTAVVDSGRTRRARYDARSGMSRLVTEPVSRAEATQRAGRAGRVAPGRCYRLWTLGVAGAMPEFPPAEIEVADLAPLALELALWGDPEGTRLRFLTPPPEGPLAQAQALLARLNAVDAGGRITAHGRTLAALPLHPRLAHMLVVAGAEAAPLAALLSARDPLRGAGTDLTLRVRALKEGGHAGPGEANPSALSQLRKEAGRLARLVPGLPAGAPRPPASSPGAMAALAYPDRVGLRRPGDAPRWHLSGGRGADMDAADGLAGARLIVATDLDGAGRRARDGGPSAGREARIRGAVPLSEADLRTVFADEIAWHEVARWSRRERRVLARRQERFGALVLDDRTWPDAPPEALAGAALDGLRDLGLPWTAASRRLQARAELYRAQGGAIADCSDAGLMAHLEEWLLPWVVGRRNAADLRALDLTEPLRARLGYQGLEILDRAMPAAFVTPLGRRLPIEYGGAVPEVAARVQEFFGTTQHPAVGPKRLPLRLTLLSPAGRPVQVTTDLPGFWSGSYADVAKDMRARYPRHPWPDDPAAADPTLRAAKRGR